MHVTRRPYQPALTKRNLLSPAWILLYRQVFLHFTSPLNIGCTRKILFNLFHAGSLLPSPTIVPSRRWNIRGTAGTLHCTVFRHTYNTALYCTQVHLQHCTVLYLGTPATLHCTVMRYTYNTALHWTVLRYTYNNALHCTVFRYMYNTALYCT